MDTNEAAAERLEAFASYCEAGGNDITDENDPKFDPYRNLTDNDREALMDALFEDAVLNGDDAGTLVTVTRWLAQQVREGKTGKGRLEGGPDTWRLEAE